MKSHTIIPEPRNFGFEHIIHAHPTSNSPHRLLEKLINHEKLGWF